MGSDIQITEYDKSELILSTSASKVVHNIDKSYNSDLESIPNDLFIS